MSHGRDDKEQCLNLPHANNCSAEIILLNIPIIGIFLLLFFFIFFLQTILEELDRDSVQECAVIEEGKMALN